MDRRRAAGALLALAACVACSTAAPTASNQTALELHESPTEGCYYNFQHYGEGDRIMTNEPCLNCTCHNRMLMCYLRVCPFTKPIGQDCTIEKRADQCCPIVTCPDVPVDLLTSTSTSSPAEYGGTGLGKVDKYGCSINGKYFSEGSKVPPAPNKPCEHCYCIRNMTTCVMQECTLHVDGCTPIYHKDVCCPVRYSCDHQEDEMLLLDDMTTTVRPTPGFLLTTTMTAVTQMSQDCVHDDQIFADGALIKTEKACEHCYCMKGDIVCVVQECGTPMENEGKNCTSLPPRQGQCCPDTYICEGDELISDVTSGTTYEDLTTLSPPRRVEGSGYRNEPDEPYTEIPAFEGSGEEQATTLDTSDMFTSQKQTPEIIDEVFAATEEPFKPSFSTIEPDKGQNTVPDDFEKSTPASDLATKTILPQDEVAMTQSSTIKSVKDSDISDVKTTISDYHHPTELGVSTEEELVMTTETAQKVYSESTEVTMGEPEPEKDTATTLIGIHEVTTVHEYLGPSSSDEASTLYDRDETHATKISTTEIPTDVFEDEKDTKPEQDTSVTSNMNNAENIATLTTNKAEYFETTSINPVENEIDEDVLPPGRIPGEGDCLLNGITYKNNTSVPNINSCHSSCKCFNSIVKCDPIICSPPPEHMDNMNDCQPIYDTPDACCPTYVCHSRETIPPESHSQMSGTESPRPSSEIPESECKDEKCQAHETAPEPCNSEDCQTQEVKECKNGLCFEQTAQSLDKSPPQKYPETCVGDNCLPSNENCIDGKCQQPTITGDICSKENGCQTSEKLPCDGANCEPDINVPKYEKPEISQPSCEGSSECDSTVTKENIIPTECAEESCRRKEQSQDEHSSECSGSNCKLPEEETHDTTDVTTEISVIDVSYKESTTEKIKSPQTDVTFIDQESQKVTHDEVMVTEKQETLELSTEKPKDITVNEVDEHVTETQQSHTVTSESQDTKLESAVTETYYQPDTEDHSIVPQEYTTKSKEQVTQSFEHITKEISTELPLIHEDHSTAPIEVESSTQEIFTEPVKTLATSTEISDTKLHLINEEKEDDTNTEIQEEFTQKYEFTTETPSLQTSGKPEFDISEEHTKKQEIYTISPEMSTTYLDETKLQTDKVMESQPEIGKTESSIPLSHETTTKQHVGDTGEEDDIITTVVNEIIDISHPVTTDSLIPVEQTTEAQQTKVEEPITNKMYDNTQTNEVLTENPNLYTEKATFETVDTVSTVSSIKDQQEYTPSPEIHETTPDKQDTYTTPVHTQEYVTSSIVSDTHATLPFITDDKHETQTQESPITEKIPTQPSDESLGTTIFKDFAMKETSTEHPEITDTTDLVITNIDETKIPPDQDIVEQSTKIPEENFQDDTTRKESVVTEDLESTVAPHDIKTEEDDIKSKPISQEPVLETTTPSIISEKNQETSTKYEDGLATDYIDDKTLAPEITATNFDKTTSPTRRVESDTATTETLEQHTVAIDDMLDKSSTSSKPAEEQNINEESTEAIATLPEKHVDDITSASPDSESTKDRESITVPGDQKVEETPLFTKPDTPETEKQSFEETGTTSPNEIVTEQIDSDAKYDSDKETFTTTVIPDVRETDAVNIDKYTPETITQSQDEETKLVSEPQPEIPTTSTHIPKNKTESPMSLVTESEVQVTSSHPIKLDDDSSQIGIDKTTQTSLVDEASEESMQSHDIHETDSHKSPTESPEASVSEKEYVYDTPSPVHPEKEKELESTSTIAAIEYITTKIPDIHKESITSSPMIEHDKLDIVTETAEQQAPTTKYQEDTTSAQISTKSEEHSLDVLHESTTTSSLIESSEKLSTMYQEEGTSKPLETITPVTDSTYNQESNIKSTDQPLNTLLETSTENQITEMVKDDHTSVYDEDFQKQDEHTMLPELLTTKYTETSENDKEKETAEYKPDKHGISTFENKEYTTTESLLNTVQPVSSDVENHSTILTEQEKSTVPIQVLDTEKDLTTPSYVPSNTMEELYSLPDIHLSTTGIITTESSIHEEDHRRTLSTAKETDFEKLTTKKQETPLKEYTTELPEVSKTEIKEDSDSTHTTSTPVEERVTLTPAYEHHEPEYVTSKPQSEDEELLQTGTMASYGNQDSPVATESVDKHITEVQYMTEKPLYNEQDLQTTKDVIIKDDVTDRTTVQDEMVQIPVETMPEKIPTLNIVPHESETESVPVETETERSSILETGTLEPHKSETELYVPLETEKSVSEEMVTSVSDEPVTSIPKETETSVTKETETSVTKETETSEAEMVTSVSDETVTSIPKAPDTSVTEDTETQEAELETSVSDETVTTIPQATETSVTKETETSEPEIITPVSDETVTSIPKETETSVTKETETSYPKETETEVSIETVTSVPKETETEIPIETVTFVPKETETEGPIETVTSVPKETETEIPIEIETSVPIKIDTSETLDITTEIYSPIEMETETLVQKETESSVPIEIGTETSVPEETSVPLKTDIAAPMHTETESSVPKETYGLLSEPTGPTVPEVTKVSEKQTETTQEYIEHESSTDQTKNDKSPEEVSPTTESIYSSSESTPYLVELQEHTNKMDEDISSVIPDNTFTTKASEIYQTERGDQPLETATDQSTQKAIYGVQTEPSVTEKGEELTTLTQELPSDYATSTSVHEGIPHKTEDVTEEDIPVESSVPTVLDASPEEHIPTMLTEEQSSTTIPTISVTSEQEKLTTLELSGTEKTPEQDTTHDTIAPEDELLPITKGTTTKKTMDTTTQFPSLQDKITKPEDKPVESYPSTTGPEMHNKPGANEIQPTEEIPSPDFPPSGTSGYGQEPDYVEEDQAFGPGTCRYGGKVYVSAQQIPRDDPCDFCFCFRSDIICLQQSCPPPIQGCHEEPIQGFCCPRYECPVSMATTLNVTTTTTTTTTTLPPHFLPHAYKGAAQRRGCQIKGHTYKVGDVVRASSGPCLHCTCGGDGQMKCDPKACTPEPMLRQMIAAAVSAKRRR